MHISRQKGNALFLILIAVALFAALGYAVTSSGRGGSSSISQEQAIIDAAKLVAYAGAIDRGMTRLQLTNGVAVTNTRFNNDYSKRLDGLLRIGAMGTPADPSPYLFHADGGGVTPQVFPAMSITCGACGVASVGPGSFDFFWMNMPGLGTSTSDLSIWISSINDAVCKEINRRFELGSVIIGVNAGAQVFATGGAIPVQASATGNTGAITTLITGKTDLCFTAGDTRNFYVHFMVVN